jgi:hypothetical protein
LSVDFNIDKPDCTKAVPSPPPGTPTPSFQRPSSPSGYTEITWDLVGEGKLINPSFENPPGWIDLSYCTRCQAPKGWVVNVLECPECIHRSQRKDPGTGGFNLPKEQWSDGPYPLILSGDWTYKVFRSGGGFSGVLTQEISLAGHEGSEILVWFPVQVHYDHGLTSPNTGKPIDTATVKIKVFDISGNKLDESVFKGLEHTWVIKESQLEFTAPSNGRITLTIEIESTDTSPNGIDFFMDDIRIFKKV